MGPGSISGSPTDELENNHIHHQIYHQIFPLNHHRHHQQQQQQLSDTTSSEDSSCNTTQDDPEYLFQLIRDRRTLQSLPNVFQHLDRLLDDEITRVHNVVLYLGTSTEPLVLPEPQGPVVTLTEKLPVPTKDYPDFNFVGRLLGPRGMTAKQLEIDTGCRILVRGRGSLRDKKKEEQMKGKSKWEHLNEDLHVLITVEDSRNRAQLKISRAIEEVQKLLVPSNEGEDELKKRQLLELALLNGTCQGFNQSGAPQPLMFHHPGAAVNGQFSPPVLGLAPGIHGGPGGLIGPGMLALPMLIRSSDAAGAPIILPHLPLLSPTNFTPLSSPVGPPSGFATPAGLLSPTSEPSGIFFHIEPCAMSPVTPTSPLALGGVHNKPPPLIIHHTHPSHQQQLFHPLQYQQ